MSPAPRATQPAAEASRPERFVFLLLENFTMIAFAGAVEPLRIANRMAGRTLYEWQVVSDGGGPVTPRTASSSRPRAGSRRSPATR